MRNKLVILLLSLTALAISSWAQEPEREPGNVVFDNPKVDLDTCYFRSDTVFTQKYHFKNVGESPVSIVRIHTGCPCVEVDLPDAPVKPDEEADVIVRFKPTRPGNFRHIISLGTDGDPRVRHVMLHVVLLNPNKR